MKKSFLSVIVLSLIFSLSLQAQWKQYNPNPNNDPANASKDRIPRPWSNWHAAPFV